SSFSDYYNAYGPTECAVCVSTYKVSEKDRKNRTIPIGKPISNTRMYVLDDNLEPQPIGVKGKIYVAGDGLARGYLNRKQLTEEKFISGLTSSVREERLYDTGDFGRWLEDGNIEYAGRADHQ